MYWIYYITLIIIGLVEGAEEQEMRKAFWLLEKEEVLRIFFGGLLASGSESALSFGEDGS